MKKLAAIFSLLIFGVCIAGGNPVLVEGRGFKVTLEDYKLMLKGMDPVPRERLENDPFAAAKYLRYIAEVEVFSRLARKEGLDKDPVVKKKIEFGIKGVLAQAYLDREVEKRVRAFRVTDDDVKQYYEVHKDEFRGPDGKYEPVDKVKNRIVEAIKEMYRKNVVQEIEDEAFRKFGVKVHPEVLRMVK